MTGIRQFVHRSQMIWVCVLMHFGALAHSAEPVDEAMSCAQVSCGLELHDGNGSAFDAPILHTDVEINVSGVALRAVVIQRFMNASEDWVEGVYRFPLPTGAAVNGLRMKIGDRVIVGEIHERQQAEHRYEQAKRTGRKASLVKAHRPNLFTTKVANLGPGETLEIEIAYFQELPLSTGAQQLRFPMVIGPRYSPRLNDASEGKINDTSIPFIPTRTRAALNHNPLAIQVLINLGVPLASVRSLYHEVKVEQNGTAYSVSLANQTTPANRDFVMEFTPRADAQPKTALLSEKFGDYVYGLMMIMPPQANAAARLAREVTFIFDRSGSMSGTSIAQAKAALLLALEQLTSVDRFNIVQFNSQSDQLFATPAPVSPETLERATSYVSKLTATGGTEMMGALARAFSSPGSNNHLQQVIFITDGNVTNEAQLFSYIERELKQRRLFTVGIGSAPNHYFLQQAAKAGKGFHTAIGDLGEVEQRMNELLNKLKKPRLRDIEIKTDHADIEYWPQTVPDLYTGEPISIAFRARPGPVAMQLDGKLPTQHWRADLSIQGGQQRQGLAELWGQRKIAALMVDHRRANGKAAQQSMIRQAVINTALDSHLVSKFTSLVAVDKTPSNFSGRPNKTKSIARNSPHGWTLGKSSMTLPQTATSANLRILSGLSLCVLLAAVVSMNRRRPEPL